ncbi:MAG: four helix bundle protein [Bacteroidia bacterium]
MKKESIIAKKSFEFALNIITLYTQLKKQKEFVISRQLLRSGTSIGANVVEASAAQSSKDFISKLAIASKEARETRYWLQLLEASNLVDLDYTNLLSQVEEIINILTAIVKTAQAKQNNS